MTKALTVWQLKELLANVSDDAYVVIATDGWYDNVSAIAIPDNDVWECVTLFRSSPTNNGDYDTRQVWATQPADIVAEVR